MTTEPPGAVSTLFGRGLSAHGSIPGPAEPATLALETYIEASMGQLVRGDGGTQPHGLLFVSSWHEAMPALVHLDPVLDPVDSRVFAVLWIWAKQQGRGSIAFPSYGYLLRRCNVQSRSTLARSLAILRITRWVTLCRRVRDRSGRNRGNIYALHEEPLALASTLYLDPDYMEFVETKARDRQERVRRVADAMRGSLQERIDEGEDLLAASPLAQAAQRVEALATIAGQESGHYFWLRQGALAAVQTPKKDPRKQAGATATDRVQNLDSGARAKICTDSVHILDSAICSSSCSDNKKTTTTLLQQSEALDEASSKAETRFSHLVHPEPLTRNEQHLAQRNVSIVLRHFFRKITVEAFPPAPVDPACALPGRQAY